MIAATEDATLADRLKDALYDHPRLQKDHHWKHIASLGVAKDVDSETGRQHAEDGGATLLYTVTQAPCQDAHGLVRRRPEVTNLRVRVGGKAAVAKVHVAFYADDGSDGSDEIEVEFTVRGATPTGAVRTALQTIAAAMVTIPGVPGEPYRHLMENGTFFRKPASTKISPTDVRIGEDKRCFENALASDLDLWVGYAMATDMQVPIAHCWNVASDGVVVDATPVWHASDAYYWGMRVDKGVASAVHAAATHGDEFMDCWRSAVQNARDDEVVNGWRRRLGWAADRE